jgi:hypothetical protein
MITPSWTSSVTAGDMRVMATFCMSPQWSRSRTICVSWRPLSSGSKFCCSDILLQCGCKLICCPRKDRGIWSRWFWCGGSGSGSVAARYGGGEVGRGESGRSLTVANVSKGGGDRWSGRQGGITEALGEGVLVILNIDDPTCTSSLRE